ncbi:uncharacterized protein LOC116360612 [Oncorhynchus kisutch]|uniref:uncharacterized protein LOC116360612 n=1 Tax=Oncorhynchus kisutch TaxID=8019 RepID=UPI0012DF6FF5|nr:uncharacterized protein LOC116360612 [Oncorhynchus kisutch]
MLLFVLISQYSGVHSPRCYCSSSSHSTEVFTHSDVTVRPHLTVQRCSLTQMLLFDLISQYRGVHSLRCYCSTSSHSTEVFTHSDSRCFCSSSSHSTEVFTHSDVTVRPHLTVQRCSLTQMLLFDLISQYRGVHSLRLQMLLFALISQYRGVHSLRCYCLSSSHSTEVFTHSDVTVRPHLTVQRCSLTQTPDVSVRPHLTVQRCSLTQMLLFDLISQYRGVHSLRCYCSTSSHSTEVFTHSDSRCYCSPSSHSTGVFTHSDVTVCPHLTVQRCSLTQTPDVTVRPHLTVQRCSLTQTPDVVRNHQTTFS